MKTNPLNESVSAFSMHPASRLRWPVRVSDVKQPLVLLASLGLLAWTEPGAFAASASWTASGTGVQAWNVTGNWGSSIPGSTSSTTNGDTATFNAATVGTQITIDANRNIKNILFDGSAGAYTIGSAGVNGGNALLLSSGGSLTLAGSFTGSGITETINAPLVLEPASSTTAATYTFTNNSTTASNVLVIAGNISGGTSTSSGTLTLTGANTSGANTISGSISDGGLAGGLSIAKTGGNWTLSGSNSYSGGTTLSGGTLNINNASALGSGTLTISAGTLDNTSGTAITLSTNNAISMKTFTFGGSNALNLGTGAVALGANTTITTNGAAALTIGGSISGGYSLTKSGSGTLILSGSNSYSGGTTFTGAGGTLAVANNYALGTGALTLVASSGTGIPVFEAYGNEAITIGNAVNLSANSYPVIIGGTTALTFGGTVTNTVTSNANSVTVSIDNTALTTFSGGIAGSSNATTRGIIFEGPGDVLVNSSVLPGSTATAANLFYYGNGTLTLSGTTTLGTGNLTAGGAGGKVVINGNATGSAGGVVYLFCGTLLLDLSTNTTGVLGSESFYLNGGNLVVKGASSGASGQTVSLLRILSGANTITIDANGGGGTTLTANSVTYSSGVALFDLSSTGAVLKAPLSLTNGIVGWGVVKDAGGIGFATTSSGNVVRYNSGTALVSNLNNAGINYTYAASGTTYALTNASHTANSLAIDTSADSGTLDLGGSGDVLTLSANGLLMTGSNNFTIQNGQLGGNTATTYIQQYGTGILTINAQIGGSATAAALYKAGDGTLVLGGANTYTGITYITGGALQAVDGVGLSSNSAIAFGGGVFQSSGTFSRNIGTSAGNVSWLANSLGGGFAAKGGTLAVQLNNGTSTLQWGSTNFLKDNTALMFGSTTADSLVDFQNGLDLGAAATAGYYRLITVVDNPNSTGDWARISGQIISSGFSDGIVKNGNGALELTNAANSYSGNTIIRAGTLLVGANALSGVNGALGNSTAAVMLGDANSNVSDNIALLTNGAYTVGRDLVVSAANTSGTTTIGGNTGDSSSFTGNILLNRNVNIQSLTTGTNAVTFASGVISGVGGITKTGAGTVIISGSETYTGDTVVSAGELDVNGSLAAGSAVSVGTGATLGGSGTVNGSVSVANGTVNGSGLKMGVTTFTGASTLSGTATASSIAISSGTTTISGNATATAGVTVGNQSMLKVNGSVSGAVNVQGTLGGIGSISGATQISGTLAPGNSVGTISTGDLTLLNNSVLDIELGRNVSTATSDRVDVTGFVTIASGADLKLTLGSGLSNLQMGDVIFLINNDGTDSISGVFTSLNGVSTTLAEGNTFSWNSQEWEITYKADYQGTSFTGGNDLALMVVPEPSTWAMLIGGMGTLFCAQRMFRRFGINRS